MTGKSVPQNLELSHPDKVMFPEQGFTKADLAEYYQQTSPTILPHLRDRPLMAQRFPDGIGAQGFYQKDAPDFFPAWVPRARLKKKEGGFIKQVMANNRSTLLYLVDLACITLHPWLSRADRPNLPDRVIFDLDPAEGVSDFPQVIQTAGMLRNLLGRIGLRPYVMTTGSRGLHVVAPLLRREGFDQVRSFAQDVAQRLAAEHPGLLTTEQRLAKRGGRLYLDVARNGYGQTSVAPYAVRALPGAPVATPLEWSELTASGLGPQSYHLGNILGRLDQQPDPWQGMGRHGRSLAQARRNLKELVG
ncbi:MAG: non-homologous end-joining DNA ligase [Proteobacteria bacterium]|nr:non-homologous end-joining DNA ligase [Pseudomonadota bacterium]MBU4382787.1 non-homologous end-joining DNA ligase [Pseudomonadota bacterium]MBU4604655.1 non-homologous end-joining DNA ligase [Pseudomonadota bacterium]MCG2765302.1 non-homologous end-joining DNA ligase [Desulfarculaceae bacterium]